MLKRHFRGSREGRKYFPVCVSEKGGSVGKYLANLMNDQSVGAVKEVRTEDGRVINYVWHSH